MAVHFTAVAQMPPRNWLVLPTREEAEPEPQPARYEQFCTDHASARGFNWRNAKGDKIVSLGLILVIVLVIFLLGGFSGRFGGYGYGYGHGGVGIIGIILIIIVVLMLLGRL
jgi:hypothetical protein